MIIFQRLFSKTLNYYIQTLLASNMFTLKIESNQMESNSTLTLNSHLSIEDNILPRNEYIFQRKNKLILNHSKEQLKFIAMLQSKFIKRKRYCFQILKQFILFPESSMETSLATVNSYDRLLFNDECLHSLQKIIETKLIENKIWAIINLKAHKKSIAIKQFTAKLNKVVRTVVFLNKFYGFSKLKDENIRILEIKSIENRKQLMRINSSKLIKSNSNVQLSRGVMQIAINSQKQIRDSYRIKQKIYLNASNQTAIESDRSDRTITINYDQASKKSGHQYIHPGNQSVKSCCSTSLNSRCCCECWSICSSFNARNDYNLGQRIKYLKYLESIQNQRC